jgi:pterin-4a-carbinolamine dehydratase
MLIERQILNQTLEEWHRIETLRLQKQKAIKNHWKTVLFVDRMLDTLENWKRTPKIALIFSDRLGRQSQLLPAFQHLLLP